MISGGVKFFEQNFALFRDGARAEAGTGDAAVKFILDNNKYTQWESIGSADTTLETITVTLPLAKTIDRILLQDFNFKEFSVKYNNGAGDLDFTNVIGVNSEVKSGINETLYERDTAYYEFSPVTTKTLVITCLKTQAANAEKELVGFIATQELGTLQGFPRVKPQFSRNEKKIKALSQKFVVQKTYETSRIRMNFKTHPYQVDIDLIQSLFDSETPFLVYLCGGRNGSPYFKIEQANWRLKDIYNMQLTGKIGNEFEKGVYVLGVNRNVTFEEHI